MQVKDLRVGMRVGRVEIVALKRVRTVSHITYAPVPDDSPATDLSLVPGTFVMAQHARRQPSATAERIVKTVTLHRFADFMPILLGPLASTSVDRRHWQSAHTISASDRTWRGENAGHRGERMLARIPYGDRAMTGPKPKPNR